MNKPKFLFQSLTFALLLIASHAFPQVAKSSMYQQNIKKADEILQQQFMEGAPVNDNRHISPETNDLARLHRTLTHILEIRQKLSKLPSPVRSSDTVSLGDTLVIGSSPGDELVIDKTWIHPGPIIIFGDGVLKFKNAHATILGDLFTFENAQVIADSSYLYFPQEYFYQRTLIFSGNSSVRIHNSTLDFGGLVHTMATVGSASLELVNVKKDDFSTVGMYNRSSITIDSITVAGEFIVDDSVSLNIGHAKTVLLWHVFGKGSTIDFSFPDGNHVGSYVFNKTVPGISGINYNIEINSCKKVMWGMMPGAGSDVKISNSNIRSVGLWFEGSDSSSVSGLVNNSHYGDFYAPINNRTFHLVNCDVTTWSIYTFDEAVVDIKGCILGEIGVMEQSSVNAFNYFLDGSGGYLWAGDTTFLVSGFSSLTSSLRSSGNSMVIFAYSTMMNGLVQALQNSVMMLVQSSISAEISYDPGAVVWMANISSPTSGFVNSTVYIKGSAWIDKGVESNLMDFDHYAMYYQKTGDTTSWYIIGASIDTEVRDDVLAGWDTHGLDPGTYFLKLDLTDNWGNSMTAQKVITLLPEVLGTEDEKISGEQPKVFPNPFNSQINCEVPGNSGNIIVFKIFDSRGKEILSKTITPSVSDVTDISIDGGNFPPGIYYYRLENGETVFTGKLVKL